MAKLTLWYVYVTLHADLQKERALRCLGKVSAKDAMDATTKARALATQTKYKQRFGGIEVRRADLPTLTTLIANREKIRYGTFVINPARRGRPTKEMQEARRQAAEKEYANEDVHEEISEG